MKKYLILLPILILAILQGAFLSLNLVLLAVLFWASIRPAEEGLLVAFIAGVFLDLAVGTTLGVSSFCLMLAGGILILYSHRFDPHHPIFITVFIFLITGLWFLAIDRYFNWQQGLILAFLALLVRMILKVLSIEPEQKGKLRI